MLIEAEVQLRVAAEGAMRWLQMADVAAAAAVAAVAVAVGTFLVVKGC